MNVLDYWKRFWKFLNQDTWQSWAVSLILAFVLIKFIFFPGLALVTGSSLPLVVVESCSMYHGVGFDEWWTENELWYERQNITKEEFQDYRFKNGMDKGDIILLWGRGDYDLGDVIVFEAGFKNPLIHRIVEDDEVMGTKGDNNFGQLSSEKEISEETIMGKGILRIPGLGWIKLIFFEGTRAPEQRGFCR